MNASARKRPLALVLASVGGGVDAIGYLTLFHLFTAHMTGNTVAAAADGVLTSWHETVRRGFPIAVFVVGVIAGSAVARRASRRGRSGLVLGLALEAGALVAFMALGARLDLGTGKEHVTAAYWVVAAAAALAMGIQSATLRRIGDHSVRTTFVTGMLTTFGEQLVAWRATTGGQARRAAARARFCAAIWAFYAAGAIAAALLERAARFRATLLPLALLALAITIEQAGRHKARRATGRLTA